MRKRNSEINAKKIEKIRRRINKGRNINRDIKNVFVFFACIFAALIIYIIYFISFESSSVINSSYNHRSDSLTKTIEKGSIISSDGIVLAYTATDDDGNETRVYPYANVFAHVIGYDSNGGMGIESAYNYYLLTSHENIFTKISNEFNNIKDHGDTLQTTLNSGLQSYIYDLMGDNSGAVICMNPDTGEIYAMVSKPDFNPNDIAEIWNTLTSEDGTENTESASSDSYLLNRVTQGLYTPGSTFKIFTLYEYYLEHSELINSFTYNCTGSISVGDTSISCLSGAHGSQDLITAFANSCNCTFATIGSNLDLTQFSQTNQKLLFGETLPIDLPSNASIFNLTEEDSEFDIMATAMGQGDTQVTPLHLAMVVSSIANDGVCMKPILAKAVLNSNNEVVTQFRNEVYKQLFTSEEASFLKSYLRKVVTDGTAYAVYPGNFQAYGKTGTAQKESSSGNYDHTWFVGWAENNEQKLTVCVILENQEEAGTSAVNISKYIFDYYFGY